MPVQNPGVTSLFALHNLHKTERAMGVSDKVFKVCESKVIKLDKQEKNVEVAIWQKKIKLNLACW